MPETKIVKTYCLMCGERCPVACTVTDGKLVRVAPDRDHPLGGTFCAKGAAAADLVYDPARLKYPMKRTNPKTADDPGWVRISWEEAMSTTAKRLLEIRSQYGAESVAYTRPAAGGSASSDYQSWLMRLFFAFGSPNLVTATYICNWHKDEGSRYTYGVGIPEPDYENSGCILCWGGNPSETAIRHAAEIERAVKRGAKLIIVDPKTIPLSAKATVQLRVTPGSDLALALGILNQVITGNLYDREFVTRWTNASFLVRQDTGRLLLAGEASDDQASEGYVAWNAKEDKPAFYSPQTVSFSTEPENLLLDGEVSIPLRGGETVRCSTAFSLLKKIVSEFTLERTARETSVAEMDILEAARLMTRSGPLSYYTYNGIEQHTDAMQTNRAICILYALVGDFERKGGMVTYPDLPWKGVSSLSLMPLEVQKRRIGGRSRPLGPAGLGLGSWASARSVPPYEFYNAVLTGEPYPMKALVSFGGNMIVANPNTERGVKALQNLEFHVHVDMYQNPTARFADVLLPATSPWESECVGKLEWKDKAHIQMRRKVVEPEFERRGDIAIIFDLAVRLGLGDLFFNGNMDEASNYMLSPLGKKIDDVRALENGFSVPLPPTHESYKATTTDGVPAGFETRTRLIEIYSTIFAEHGYDPLPRFARPPERQRLGEGQVLFTAYKPIFFTHGSYRSLPSLRKAMPHPQILIHPKTAEKFGVKNGGWVNVDTGKGSVRMVANFDKGISPNVVIGQEGWWQACESLGMQSYDPFKDSGSNLNMMIDEEFTDQISGSIAMRGVPCKITPSDSPPLAFTG